MLLVVYADHLSVCICNDHLGVDVGVGMQNKKSTTDREKPQKWMENRPA